MSNTDSITIKLSNNDFFYVSAKDMPNDGSCNDTYLETESGNCVPSDVSYNWTDNSSNCYKKELCKNKEKANEINNLQNNHLGTDQNYLNSKVIYSVELRRGISLSIGILILFGTIIYSKGK
jgi:hypothetical protein